MTWHRFTPRDGTTECATCGGDPDALDHYPNGHAPMTTTTDSPVYTRTISTTVRVSADAVADWVDAAGFGIRYWATAAVVDAEARTYAVTWHDDPDERDSTPNTRVLTFEDLVTAAVALVAGKVEGYGDTDQLGTLRAHLLNVDDDDVDSDLADAIVQTAIFGRVVFG